MTVNVSDTTLKLKKHPTLLMSNLMLAYDPSQINAYAFFPCRMRRPRRSRNIYWNSCCYQLVFKLGVDLTQRHTGEVIRSGLCCFHMKKTNLTQILSHNFNNTKTDTIG